MKFQASVTKIEVDGDTDRQMVFFDIDGQSISGFIEFPMSVYALPKNQRTFVIELIPVPDKTYTARWEIPAENIDYTDAKIVFNTILYEVGRHGEMLNARFSAGGFQFRLMTEEEKFPFELERGIYYKLIVR